MTKRGKYIVLEGGEGVGKTTQATLLVEVLRAYSITAEIVREPGGDPVGEQIRSILLAEDSEIEAKAEVLLFNAARVQTLKQIELKLAQGIWVVSDRSYVSTMAYQGFGRGLALDDLQTICENAVADLWPDLLLVMHCSAAIATSRRTSRGVNDRFEQEAAEFHERVNAGFAALARLQDIPVIDADPSEFEVQQAIWAQTVSLITKGAEVE